jgi:hypothetical protein
MLDLRPTLDTVNRPRTNRTIHAPQDWDPAIYELHLVRGCIYDEPITYNYHY